MDQLPQNWQNQSGLHPKGFTCGHCNHYMSSNVGYHTTASVAEPNIYICAHCGRPNFFEARAEGVVQVPGAAPGGAIDNLPTSVGALYDEARNCMKVSAYTSSVLACRKLLMNIAVAEGADEGDSFLKYVEYLADEGYVPPGGKSWVDHIRKQGNEATHEIDMKSEAEAKDLISFVEMLLKFIYEFPARVPANGST
jgi:hypothetical protein